MSYLGTKSNAIVPYAYTKRLLKWLLPLVAILPAMAKAGQYDCLRTTFNGLNMFLPANLNESADNILPGILFPSTAPVSEYLVSFNYAPECAEKYVKSITVQPFGKVVSGVTYTDGGQTYPVYETNVPGVGYAFGVSLSSKGPWTPVKPGKTEIFSGSSPTLMVYQRASLVATGRVATGKYTISEQNIALVKSTLGNGTSVSDIGYFRSIGTFNVTARGCKVTSGATNAVVLPALVTHSLKEVGAVSNASASFSIGVNCDTNVELYATLTDASNPANTSDTLTLTGNSTATGVGIQMFRPGQTAAQRLGPDSSAKGNTNQWYVGGTSASNGTISVPLTAKYVKTEPTMKPGTVSALGTITFSYQ
ncbi:fimbrial protein [Cupriavidus basilensis]|uniref:fimbrial protein n=1 Tax=Cupriavidus basilensis TaxID=68895 RepID=UPI0020A67292|nr:fimbrial protein [Cupriavidus basilensis]MCP3017740.1 fimbrial protein [Cupriavidus basilensis]